MALCVGFVNDDHRIGCLAEANPHSELCPAHEAILRAEYDAEQTRRTRKTRPDRPPLFVVIEGDST
jgi:hypothetical protein